ncbi:MAG: glycosyltransferase, partial [Candidatus Subteraquimicrobiales bacterium]|nr:glycosyltransferase [Candidatus Subteraquimicrobiales bacterium]
KPDNKILLRCFSYIERMNLAYAACDLVLSRAGAISIAEITAVGVPSILVPYPHASGGHQEKNARHLESQRAAEVILDSDLNGSTLYEAISRLVYDEEKLSEMRKKALLAGKPKAAEELAELVEELFVS